VIQNEQTLLLSDQSKDASLAQLTQWSHYLIQNQPNWKLLAYISKNVYTAHCMVIHAYSHIPQTTSTPTVYLYDLFIKYTCTLYSVGIQRIPYTAYMYSVSTQFK